MHVFAGFVPVLTLSPEGIPEDALNPASRPSHTFDLITTFDGTASTATTNLVITLCNLSNLPIPDPDFLSTLGSQRRTPPRRVSRPQITIASLDKEPPRRPNTLTGLTLFQSQWSAPVRRSLDIASAMASGLRRPKASKRGSFNNLSSDATTGPQSTATASGKMSPLGPSSPGTALAAGAQYAEGASHRPRHDAAGLLNQVDKPLYLEVSVLRTQQLAGAMLRHTSTVDNLESMRACMTFGSAHMPALPPCRALPHPPIPCGA